MRTLRSALALGSLLALGACGSRSGLPVPTLGSGGQAGSAGTAGTSGSGGTAGTSGTGGSAGSGGAPSFVCPVLSWVGPALSVPLTGPEMDPLATSARSPKLVRTGPSEYAVVFEATIFHDAPSALLASFPLHDPFGAWPPSAGTPSPIATEASGFGAAPGDPGLIAVAYHDADTGERVLAEATSGGGTQIAHSWPVSFEKIQFLSASAAGAYLLGSGEKLLWVDRLSSIASDPLMDGPLGCSGASLLGASAALPSGEWLVASADDASDTCNDPKPPPKPPQNVRVSRFSNSSWQTTQVVPGGSPLTSLALAARSQGAWLGYAHNDESNGAFIYRVHAVDALGGVDPSPVLFVAPTQGAPGPEDYALTALGPSFALAAVTRDTIIPGGNFQLGVFYQSSLTTLDGASFGGAYFPDSAPTLAASDDGRSLLLVFVDGNDSHPVTMTLLRADCGLVE